MELHIECASCGAELLAPEDVYTSWNGIKIKIQPCSVCVHAAEEQAFNAGTEASLYESPKEKAK